MAKLGSESFGASSSGKLKLHVKRAKKHPDAPKRPATAYTLFVADNRHLHASEGVSAQEVMRRVAGSWRAISDQDRLPYELRAKESRNDYQKKIREFRSRNASEDHSDPTAAAMTFPSTLPAHGVTIPTSAVGLGASISSAAAAAAAAASASVSNMGFSVPTSAPGTLGATMPLFGTDDLTVSPAKKAKKAKKTKKGRE